jgi:endonuclease/exonuclease/phosphatase family metal-dependent hydrolase
MVRILTYNVHRCVGTDGRLDVGRIAAVIAAQDPDIVALQEVDVRRARTGGVDQVEEIARRLGMSSHFHAALTIEEEEYGDAILTDLPERLVKSGPLPGYAPLPRLEPRGALWVAIQAGEAELQVVNTHLGLVPREQMLQARALAGPEWLAHPQQRGPVALVGDLNAGVRSAVCRCLRARLHDARRAVGGPRLATTTFPSRLPVARLDHVLVSEGVKVRALHVPKDSLARAASDHLPLVADLDLFMPP